MSEVHFDSIRRDTTVCQDEPTRLIAHQQVPISLVRIHIPVGVRRSLRSVIGAGTASAVELDLDGLGPPESCRSDRLEDRLIKRNIIELALSGTNGCRLLFA